MSSIDIMPFVDERKDNIFEVNIKLEVFSFFWLRLLHAPLRGCACVVCVYVCLHTCVQMFVFGPRFLCFIFLSNIFKRVNRLAQAH